MVDSMRVDCLADFQQPVITPGMYAAAAKVVLDMAQRDCGGSEVCAQVLLGSYNSFNFHLNITDLGRLDRVLYGNCLTVIRGRVELKIEPHDLFVGGSEVFKALCKQWEGISLKARGARVA